MSYEAGTSVEVLVNCIDCGVPHIIRGQTTQPTSHDQTNTRLNLTDVCPRVADVLRKTAARAGDHLVPIELIRPLDAVTLLGDEVRGHVPR